MQRYIRFALLITLLLVWIEGCASQAKFAERNNAWVGKNIAYFIAQRGYPDRTFTLPNNHKVYVYETSKIVTYPSIGFGYGAGYSFGGYGLLEYGGSNVRQKVCKLFVETDKHGTIVTWGSRGNACASE